MGVLFRDLHPRLSRYVRALEPRAADDLLGESWLAIAKGLPTFQGDGTHVNLSGVVLAKHAPHKAEALKLMEWLVGDKAQHMYADMNYEYPVRPGIPLNPTIARYGPLKPDPMPISKIAEQRKAAANLVDKVGFDQ